jgi:hypothetical protein
MKKGFAQLLRESSTAKANTIVSTCPPSENSDIEDACGLSMMSDEMEPCDI